MEENVGSNFHRFFIALYSAICVLAVFISVSAAVVTNHWKVIIWANIFPKDKNIIFISKGQYRWVHFIRRCAPEKWLGVDYDWFCHVGLQFCNFHTSVFHLYLLLSHGVPPEKFVLSAMLEGWRRQRRFLGHDRSLAYRFVWILLSFISQKCFVARFSLMIAYLTFRSVYRYDPLGFHCSLYAHSRSWHHVRWHSWLRQRTETNALVRDFISTDSRTVWSYRLWLLLLCTRLWIKDWWHRRHDHRQQHCTRNRSRVQLVPVYSLGWNLSC